MDYFELIWRKLKLIAVVVALWLAVQGELLAAQKEKIVEKSEGGGSQSWVFPYCVVLLAIGLGMLAVCRSSRRAERSKPAQYESLDTGR